MGEKYIMIREAIGFVCLQVGHRYALFLRRSCMQSSKSCCATFPTECWTLVCSVCACRQYGDIKHNINFLSFCLVSFFKKVKPASNERRGSQAVRQKRIGSAREEIASSKKPRLKTKLKKGTKRSNTHKHQESCCQQYRAELPAPPTLYYCCCF